VTPQSDLNSAAIQELIQLIETDTFLTEEWKRAVLGLIRDGLIPATVQPLETILKSGV